MTSATIKVQGTNVTNIRIIYRFIGGVHFAIPNSQLTPFHKKQG